MAQVATSHGPKVTWRSVAGFEDDLNVDVHTPGEVRDALPGTEMEL